MFRPGGDTFRKRTLSLLLLASFLLPANAGAAQKPVTIQDTVNAILHSHRTIKAMQENRDVIIHELRRAKSGWGPRVDVTSRVGMSKLSNTTTRSYNADTGFYGASGVGVALVQPLWDGFATRSRVRSAESTLDSMTNRVFDNATSLGLDGIIAHIDVIRRREIYRLAELYVERHKEILTSSRDRQQLGADTMADVTQTEGRLARALSTLVEAKASLLEGEEVYRRLTNGPAPVHMAPVGLPDRLFSGPEPIVEEAKLHNPKLAAYLDDIKTARGDQELSEAPFHPVINLEAGPNYSDRGGSGSNWTNSFEVMTTMRWNVFNSGGDVAGNEAAKSRVRMSRQVMYNFVDDLQQEIENTWIIYQSAKDQYQHYTDAIGYNTLTRDAYLEQFTTGQRSLLDVLDAESELFNSSTQAVTAQGNILVGTYRLLALAGVLLPDLHIDTKDLYNAPKESSMPEGASPFSTRRTRP